MASMEFNGGMEARIARLESDVAHIRTDLADVKADVRSMRDKLDAKIDAKFDGLTAWIDRLSDSLAAAKVWALLLYIALAAGLFGTLARGFGWL